MPGKQPLGPSAWGECVQGISRGCWGSTRSPSQSLGSWLRSSPSIFPWGLPETALSESPRDLSFLAANIWPCRRWGALGCLACTPTWTKLGAQGASGSGGASVGLGCYNENTTAWAVITNRYLFLTAPDTGKSKTTQQTDWVSGEGGLWLQVVPASCVLAQWAGGGAGGGGFHMGFTLKT